MERSILKRIQAYRLMDDAFMQQCFQDNRECVELVLRIIMEKPDLEVRRVSAQKKLHNLRGRSLCLDILATDGEGRMFNIEVQRSYAGASPARARIHSSLMDAHVSRPGRRFDRLPETCVIFITEKDVLGGGKPLYTITRRVEETGRPFGDGSRIIYVNGAMREGDTPLAKLMRDFFCADPDAMHYEPLARITGYFKKDEQGVRAMYGEIERLWRQGRREGRKEGREEGRAQGREEGRAEEKKSGAARMLALGKLTYEEIAQASNLSLDEVRALANRTKT